MDLVDGQTEEIRDYLMSRFISLNRPVLSQCAPGQSWYLPRELGGLGLPVWKGTTYTDTQLKMAAYFATRQDTDPDLRAFLLADSPQFLSNYLQYRGQVAEDLGYVGQVVNPKTAMSLPGLCWWTGGGWEGGEPETIHTRSLQRWTALKKRATATKLKPMGLDTVNAYSRAYSEEYGEAMRWTVTV